MFEQRKHIKHSPTPQTIALGGKAAAFFFLKPLVEGHKFKRHEASDDNPRMAGCILH